MPDIHEIDEARGIVLVRSVGDLSAEELAESVARVIEAGQRDDIHGILVDATELHTLPSTGEVFNIFASFPRGLRAAIILGEQPSAEEIRFVETISINRGTLIRAFIAREDAEAWLLAGGT